LAETVIKSAAEGLVSGLLLLRVRTIVLAPKLRLGRSIPEALLPRKRRWLTERLDEAELRKRLYRSRAAVRGESYKVKAAAERENRPEKCRNARPHPDHTRCPFAPKPIWHTPR